MQNYSIQFKAMGSHMQAWLNAASPAGADILAQVPVWFEEWEACLSRFRPTSELSLLNARAGEWVSVSPVLYEIITDALEAAEMTDGWFNPLILNALEAAGYDHSFDDPAPSRRKAESMSSAAQIVPSWQSVGIDAEHGKVRLPAGSRIDLGGIAKGWAAQEAADRLYEYGACLIDAGGDLVAHGSPDDSGGWITAIPNADETGVLTVVLLVDEAAATSGTDVRRWQRGGQIMHHLIDPRTGQPAETQVLRSTVIAPDAEQAVIWSKISLMRGELSEYPTLFIHHDGTVQSNWEVQTL